jgi:hypothetical protein
VHRRRRRGVGGAQLAVGEECGREARVELLSHEPLGGGREGWGSGSLG